MDYIEGGTLWDVLESTPLERIREVDLRWWLPQVISAIAWCHSQGFVHRDVKPHNFVLDRSAHVRLIDFGSAAPLVLGSRLVPPEYCRVPCGTCDYISPEILQAHESALVAIEMSADEADEGEMGEGGYGVETDWWSTGAMIYEMAYGVAPFFARDIRSTYLKIIDFRTSLMFHANVSVSTELRDLLIHLLTDAQVRLGRHGTREVMQHPFFDGTRWETLHSEHYPSDLHLPQFTYNEDLPGEHEPCLPEPYQEQPTNSPFDFSALFQPSDDSSSLTLPILRTTPGSILRQAAESFFVGFSWGPSVGAFPDPPPITTTTSAAAPTPVLSSYHQTQVPQTPTPAALGSNELATPKRSGIGIVSCASTLRHTRTAPRRRPVSDREAMRQLVDCIGLSARKKVLAAGRTPRGSTLGPSRIKTLRFAAEPPEPLDFAEPWPAEAARYSPNTGTRAWGDDDSSKLDGTAVFALDIGGEDESDGASASDVPPSPSPSPRPGSAMSMLSRRSVTPTGSLLMRLPPPNDTRGVATAQQRQHSPREAPVASSSSPSIRPSINMRAADDSSENALEVLEERHRALMCEIASIEGRVGAMKRWTG